MGLRKSKDRLDPLENISVEVANEEQLKTIEDSEEVSLLKIEFHHNLEEFLLNQLVFGVLHQEIPDQELELSNLEIAKDEVFTTHWHPDVKLEQANEIYKFDNGKKEENLFTSRVFLQNNSVNIAANCKNETSNKLSVDITPVIISGYVKFRYVENKSFEEILNTGLPPYGTKLKFITTLTKIRCEYYLNHKKFLQEFSEVWPDLISNSKFINQHLEKGYIHLENSLNELYDVYPSIKIPWTKSEDFKQQVKQFRKLSNDMNKNLYTWPTNAMVEDLAEMPCLALARGSLVSNESTVRQNLDWEVSYPLQEEYLQNSLTQSHMKVLIGLMLLHKSFVESKTKLEGLTGRHLVTALFWNLHESVLMDETRLGRRILEVVTKLCNEIGKEELLDFFDNSYNLFDSLDSSKLRLALGAFCKIRNSPFVYFLSAFRNLTVKNQLSQMDFKKLYQILNGNIDTKNSQENSVEEAEDYINYTIGFEIFEENCLEKEINVLERNHNLLKFFLDHFLTLAEEFIKLKKEKQAFLYLNHCDNLKELFDILFKADKDKYQEVIKDLRTKLPKQIDSNDKEQLVKLVKEYLLETNN